MRRRGSGYGLLGGLLSGTVAAAMLVAPPVAQAAPACPPAGAPAAGAPADAPAGSVAAGGVVGIGGSAGGSGIGGLAGGSASGGAVATRPPAAPGAGSDSDTNRTTPNQGTEGAASPAAHRGDTGDSSQERTSDPASSSTPAPPSPATTTAPPPAATSEPACPSADAGADTSAAALNGWGEPNRVDEFDGTSLSDEWEPYDGPGHNGAGRRSPGAFSVADGVLTVNGSADGTTGGMAWNPGQKYGRWEARVKSPSADPSYHAVLLLWPDAEDWPVGGEVDFMEDSDPSRQNTDMFLHYGQDNSQVQGDVDIDATQWHDWAVEWTPDHIAAYVDGKQWWRTDDTGILPPGPMHLTIQLDWFPEGGGDVKASTMQIDWVKQYPLSDDQQAGGGDGKNGQRSGDSGGKNGPANATSGDIADRDSASGSARSSTSGDGQGEGDTGDAGSHRGSSGAAGESGDSSDGGDGAADAGGSSHDG